MPAIAHIGVGFAAKKFAPKVNVLFLILAAELIEIIFFVFVAAGIEIMPSDAAAPFAPYSHGLFMGIIWSVAAGLLTYVILKNKRTAIIIGLLVLSHTILDLIASPKLAFYPTDTAMPVFFDNTFSAGLGLWQYETFALISEALFLLVGLAVYIYTVVRQRKKRSLSQGEF
jgi:hypothetical protein